ncbi:MAG: hypothetical protein CHACPFDD_01792 [Phycisphaerae bacterium]|nr:hypothetical protein [Phycisphaerae bacterium]
MKRLIPTVTTIIATLLSCTMGGCPSEDSGVFDDPSPSANKQNVAGEQGPPGPQGPQGPQGTQGPQGEPGEDGQMRVYGDGSAGAKNVAVNETLDDFNLQFTDLTVATGTTLFVPSGMVIRCSGRCTIDGTIVVFSDAFGAILNGGSTPNNADVGVARRPAMNGIQATSPSPVFGGSGGIAVAVGASIPLPPFTGGGGGGVALSIGGDGGGCVTILARGGITVGPAGVVRANGQTTFNGDGGGAGGLIVLATPAEFVNNGVIEANGGNGGDSSSATAPGGGGGGGIIYVIAASFPNGRGIQNVVGGKAGRVNGNVTSTTRAAGAGGGACGGNGGSGGSITGASPIAPTNAADGATGLTNNITADPTSMF